MRFEFMTATRIIFGPATLREVGSVAAEFGRQVLVVTGGDSSRAARLLEVLREHHLIASVFQIHGEPTIDMIEKGVELARLVGSRLVIGFGGGSALDAAKAIAALATNPGEPLNYLEVIGQNLPLTVPPLPCIAIPTTAGTGAEVTRNAVLASPDHQVKVSLRSPLMLPRLALVDPELTYYLPPDLTASTGMDALTQLIEPFTSNAANPITDALCRDGLTRIAWALRRAYTRGHDEAAREAMALASLYGGLALANARLGAVHGIAGPLGGMFPIPHGVACAALLAETMALNVRLLRERDPEGDGVRRYTEIARLLTGEPDATAEAGVAWVRTLTADLQIPALTSYGMRAADFPGLAAKAAKSSSLKGNPVPLTSDEIVGLLNAALHRA